MDSLGLPYKASLPSKTFAGFARSDKDRAIELAIIFYPMTFLRWLVEVVTDVNGCYLTFGVSDKINAKLCGFSDLTVLLNYLYQEYDALCFHGPMLQWPSAVQNNSLLWQSFQSIVLKIPHLIVLLMENFKLRISEWSNYRRKFKCDLCFFGDTLCS